MIFGAKHSGWLRKFTTISNLSQFVYNFCNFVKIFREFSQKCTTFVSLFLANLLRHHRVKIFFSGSCKYKEMKFCRFDIFNKLLTKTDEIDWISHIGQYWHNSIILINFWTNLICVVTILPKFTSAEIWRPLTSMTWGLIKFGEFEEFDKFDESDKFDYPWQIWSNFISLTSLDQIL